MKLDGEWNDVRDVLCANCSHPYSDHDGEANAENENGACGVGEGDCDCVEFVPTEPRVLACRWELNNLGPGADYDGLCCREPRAKGSLFCKDHPNGKVLQSNFPSADIVCPHCAYRHTKSVRVADETTVDCRRCCLPFVVERLAGYLYRTRLAEVARGK